MEIKKISLQYISDKWATPLKNCVVGDIMICNGGYTQKFVGLVPSKSGKTYNVAIECNGKIYEHKMSANRYIAILRINKGVKEKRL